MASRAPRAKSAKLIGDLPPRWTCVNSTAPSPHATIPSPISVPGAPTEVDHVVNFGPYSFNLGTRALTREGEYVPLTTGEFSLLKVFAQNPRVPLSRDKLAELARGREAALAGEIGTGSEGKPSSSGGFEDITSRTPVAVCKAQEARIFHAISLH